MSADLYALYDEQTGAILHVHATPQGAVQSPEEINAILGVGHDRAVRVLKLPASGLTRPARVVNGELQDAPEDVAFAGAEIKLTDQAPPQTAPRRSRTFQRRVGT
jgi:alkylated DNA nucleotide flippase Atl1